jgi:hypothetical protein
MSPPDDDNFDILDQQEPWQDEGLEASTSNSADLHIDFPSPDIESGRFPIPVWMRESSKGFHWKWVPLPIRQSFRSFAAWSKGPNPPQIQSIEPFFPFIQEAPLKLVDRFLPTKKHKAAALAVFYGAWILTFTLILHYSSQSGNIEGYGQPSPIWCGASFWNGGNGCELDGNKCRPFDNAIFAFSCPADCARLKIQAPYAVGDQEVVYESLVIGGAEETSLGENAKDPIYRADSFICQSAVHAGVVSNKEGGCGVVAFKGKQSHFPAVDRNGIQSIGFDAEFPKSFTFVSGISSECGYSDPRWPLLGVTVTFTSLLSLFTSSPAVFFPSIFTMLFFHVGIVSDPPNISDYPSLTSLIVGRFLPAAFVGYVIYRFCVKRQLAGLTAQFEKTILWLGGAWVGSLNNYTFDHIPISRLTPHDIKAQPGAVLALILIILVIFVAALGQIWYLRLEGRFLRYLVVYAIMGAFLIVCVIIPQLNLRIHHYVLALLLLPGTAIQTRPSLLYQGILVGLFINGVARWGFDSILQTSGALFTGGPTDSLLPNITEVVIGAANITFEWALPPAPYDGVSILVNDVERHRWYYGEGDPVYTRAVGRDHLGSKEYIRFGYMIGSSTADYTKAGIWKAAGNWTVMPPGPSL